MTEKTEEPFRITPTGVASFVFEIEGYNPCVIDIDDRETVIQIISTILLHIDDGMDIKSYENDSEQHSTLKKILNKE